MITNATIVAIATHAKGLAKLSVQPKDGCNLGTMRRGSFLLK